MKNIKDFSDFYAEKLTYVIFSGFEELLIQEFSQKKDTGFDYLIDISDSGQQTGRFFGVQVKASKKEKINETIRKLNLRKYEKIKLPFILVIVNTRKNKTYYSWIIQPVEKGKLTNSYNNFELSELNNENVKKLIKDITNWYDYK